MNNKVVFTHDVPGERKWLLEIFSDYRSLETKDSRIWPTDFPTPGNNNTLYEIPYCDNVDYDRLLATDIEKVKSFFVDNPDLVFLDNKNWGYASSYVSREIGRAHV